MTYALVRDYRSILRRLAIGAIPNGVFAAGPSRHTKPGPVAGTKCKILFHVGPSLGTIAPSPGRRRKR